MDVVIALYAAASVLLVAAGAMKLARPGPTTDLVVSLGLPASSGGVVALGAMEAALGFTALAGDWAWPAPVVALLYLGFAGVMGRALSVGAVSCGCFGRTDAPPSPIHLVGNLMFATASAAVAVGGRSPLEVMADQPAAGVPFVVLVGVLSGLALVAFTAWPEAAAARRGRPARPVAFAVDRSGTVDEPAGDRR